MSDPAETADRFATWTVRLLGVALVGFGAFTLEQSLLLGAAAILVGLAIAAFPRQAMDVGEGLVNFG